MLFAISDSVLTVLCLAVIGAMNAIIAYLQAKTKAAVEKANEDANILAVKAATKAEENRRKSFVEREVIAEKIEAISKATEQVHERVNSDSEKKDKLLMVALKRIYELSGKPEDKIIADEAERIYQANAARQAAADTKGTCT